jgi:hypothetical protein
VTKYTITLELDEGVNKSTGEERTPEQIIKYLQLSLQQAITRADVLLLRAEVKEGKVGSGGHASRDGSTPGRKPTNRPKVEDWIRRNITAGPSTQGTVGLEGVDRNGFPKDLPNRVFIHRMALPLEDGGCGVSKLGIQKVLSELETEGYLERGFAAGAPFYELIRPLEEPGKVGVRGRPLEEDEEFYAPATPMTLDFSGA